MLMGAPLPSKNTSPQGMPNFSTPQATLTGPKPAGQAATQEKLQQQQETLVPSEGKTQERDPNSSAQKCRSPAPKSARSTTLEPMHTAGAGLPGAQATRGPPTPQH